MGNARNCTGIVNPEVGDLVGLSSAFSGRASGLLKTPSTLLRTQPTGVMTLGESTVKIVPKKFKVHSLTGRINPQLMRLAFKAVKKNRGAAGLDKVSIKMFEKNLQQNLDALMRELKSRTYKPIPLKRVYIPKGGGKLRPLGIPAVRCRIAQEVVRRLIEPIFEQQFLGFYISDRTTRMRPKSVEKFKMKIRTLTKRSHNLDAEVIIKLNRVIRGTVNYFAPPFATVIAQFKTLDGWIRKRIRCMKYKRISRVDNKRMKIKHIRRLGLLSCWDLCLAVKER